MKERKRKRKRGREETREKTIFPHSLYSFLPSFLRARRLVHSLVRRPVACASTRRRSPSSRRPPSFPLGESAGGATEGASQRRESHHHRWTVAAAGEREAGFSLLLLLILFSLRFSLRGERTVQEQGPCHRVVAQSKQNQRAFERKHLHRLLFFFFF